MKKAQEGSGNPLEDQLKITKQKAEEKEQWVAELEGKIRKLNQDNGAVQEKLDKYILRLQAAQQELCIKEQDVQQLTAELSDFDRLIEEEGQKKNKLKAKMAGKDAKQIDADEMKAVFDKVLDEQLVAMVDQQVRVPCNTFQHGGAHLTRLGALRRGSMGACSEPVSARSRALLAPLAALMPPTTTA